MTQYNHDSLMLALIMGVDNGLFAQWHIYRELLSINDVISNVISEVASDRVSDVIGKSQSIIRDDDRHRVTLKPQSLAVHYHLRVPPYA